MTPREILHVSIHKLVEETQAGSQETWVLISTLSLPTCETSQPQFPDPPDWKDDSIPAFLTGLSKLSTGQRR